MQAEQHNESWMDFEKVLFSELEKKGSLTVMEIMQSSGLSRNAVSVRLRKLKDQGLIDALEKPKSPKQRYRLTQSKAQ